MPMPRYIVRRVQSDQRYSVWDNDNNKIAVFDDCECVDLNFDDAFRLADHLNTHITQAKEE